jgi:glycosyltransferase involved in cell wall biosynthesis
MAQISIIMATFNRAALILESLDAIKNQTFSNWECLIIDDGSKDNTANLVEEYTSKDSRFIYLPRSKDYKKGLPGCRNQGLDLSKGEFIVFFDDDDIPHPQLLELTVAELQKTNYDFCRYLRDTFYGQFTRKIEFIESYTTNKIDLGDLEAVIENEIPFNSCQVMWRKSSIAKSRFEESLMYAEDWEFYTRILSSGLEGITINEQLYFGRKHRNSNTGEFYRKDKKRLSSKITGSNLIIQHLGEKKLLSKRLKKFFIQLGFQLKSLEIIDNTLHYSGAGFFEKLKYTIGFKAYPVLRPLFLLKGKIFSR